MKWTRLKFSILNLVMIFLLINFLTGCNGVDSFGEGKLIEDLLITEAKPGHFEISFISKEPVGQEISKWCENDLLKEKKPDLIFSYDEGISSPLGKILKKADENIGHNYSCFEILGKDSGTIKLFLGYFQVKEEGGAFWSYAMSVYPDFPERSTKSLIEKLKRCTKK